MNLLYVCVPGVTSRKTFSARVRVRRRERGVREIVERIRWPPGCKSSGLLLPEPYWFDSP